MLSIAPISTLTTFQPSNGMNADMELGISPTAVNQLSNNFESGQEQISIDCEVTAWSQWSPCSCDANPKKERKRKIKVYPQGQGKQCPKLTQRRKCKNKNRHSTQNCLGKNDFLSSPVPF